MNFCDINPFIRYAGEMYYVSETNWVKVKDCRIFYVRSGKADIFIQNQHHELIPGSLFYCCSGSVYNIETSGVSIYCLNFDLSQTDSEQTTIYPRIRVEDSFSSPDSPDCIVEDSDYLSSHLFIKNGQEYAETLKLILSEYDTRFIFYQERGSALLKNILAQMHRHSLTPSSNHATSVIADTISYIKAHYNETISNKSLSALTGYHEYHLNRLFMKHTNTSIHQYIITIRIEEAKKLLLNTDYSVSLISEKVGFNSNTHFSNYFKQMVGTSPLQFRKQFKNQI